MPPSEPTPFERPADPSLPLGSSAWFGNLDQPSFEVEFYERVLQQQPSNVQVLKLLGELYARQGRHDRALVVDQKLYELSPDDAVVSYNLACSLAMQDAGAQAVEALARALELGYNDFSHLEVDPDLEKLRPLPEFQSLLQKYGLDR
jgi:tetratricopeptide (TPR) repeat protein